VTEKFDQAYKSIGEVARLLKLVNKKNGNLNTHTIRYWEKEFKIITPRIMSGKRRYYNLIEIEKLKKIQYLLKNKGLTIKGAKLFIDNNKSLDLDETSNNSINTFNKEILKNKINKISKLVKSFKLKK
tara:strand:- start:510 stop:893 length:384 start_codon:yes stop_codon:yes gene_type:complete